MYEIISKGYLAAEIKDAYYIVGEIRKEVDKGNYISYVFDIDKKSIQEISNYGIDNSLSTLITGIDLDYGYFQRHSKVPFFISMRTPDRRREDMHEILERYGLDYYNQFEMLLINKGKSLDIWRVLRNLDDYPILNKDAYLKYRKESADKN